MTYKTLREFRVSKGMRVIDLGEVLGYSSPHISNIERDQARPGADFVQAFKKAYPDVKIEKWGDVSLKRGRGEVQAIKGVLEVEQAIEEAYQNLAIAIVEQAIKDYKSCIEWAETGKETIRTPEGTLTIDEVYSLYESCKEFFLGDWIKELTTMDGEFILKNLEKQVGTIKPLFEL